MAEKLKKSLENSGIERMLVIDLSKALTTWDIDQNSRISSVSGREESWKSD